MDRQLRRPAREAQRIRPAAYTGARGWDGRGRNGGGDDRGDTGQELVGLMFSTPKELRHVAEQHFGELFVPTEVVESARLRAVIALKTERAGTLLVHAERERHWYPFRVVRVDTPRLDPRAGNGRGDASRPRPPHGYRIGTRPRIDWL
ncbi:MAG TPA: hypothetical protein VFJ82_07345 [Longimicrobium sp.]|nr:hypothetical protein [Longimicrobium sp.]